MKTNLKYVWMLAAALTLGISSCNKDDAGPENGGPDVIAGEDTWITVNFTSPKTYATDPGTVAESAIQTVDIAIFENASGAWVSHRQITGLNGATGWNGRIQTKTGASQVFVGVNLPAAVSAKLAANTITKTSLEALIETLSVSDIATNNQFVMTSALTPATFTEWDGTGTAPTGNDITLSVKRLAAKFTVQEGASLSLPVNTDGGKISDLRFAVGQINTKTYIVEHIVAGLVQDPNYSYTGPFPAPDLTTEPAYADFIAISPNGTANNQMAAKYALENTNDNMLSGNLTYLTVAAKFYPEEYYTSATATAQNDKDPDDTFWMVDDAGTKAYFYSETVAAAYCGANSINPGDIKKYENSICYYTVYVNGISTGYDVYRNDFYKSTINSIAGLGENKPGPVDPTVPPGGTTNIEVTITVEPWNLIEEEHDLTPQ